MQQTEKTYIEPSRKKIFFDTEFTGLHQKTTLISIGLISECGKTFYAEFNDFDYSQTGDWIKENVLSKLKYNGTFQILEQNEKITGVYHPMGSDSISYKSNKENIREKLTTWLEQFGEVEMWSDCLAYDWVLFNNIFGDAFSIPKNVYYIPFDICTLFYLKGIDADVSRETFADMKPSAAVPPSEPAESKHNALWDAKVIRACYLKLSESNQIY
jgi:hypothetical protein